MTEYQICLAKILLAWQEWTPGTGNYPNDSRDDLAAANGIHDMLCKHGYVSNSSELLDKGKRLIEMFKIGVGYR